MREVDALIQIVELRVQNFCEIGSGDIYPIVCTVVNATVNYAWIFRPWNVHSFVALPNVTSLYCYVVCWDMYPLIGCVIHCEPGEIHIISPNPHWVSILHTIYEGSGFVSPLDSQLFIYYDVFLVPTVVYYNCITTCGVVYGRLNGQKISRDIDRGRCVNL